MTLKKKFCLSWCARETCYHFPLASFLISASSNSLSLEFPVGRMKYEPSSKFRNSIDMKRQVLIRRTFFACVYHVSINRGLRGKETEETSAKKKARRKRNGAQHIETCDILMIYLWGFLLLRFSFSACAWIPVSSVFHSSRDAIMSICLQLH